MGTIISRGFEEEENLGFKSIVEFIFAVQTFYISFAEFNFANLRKKQQKIYVNEASFVSI